jgi:hypothetical protein
MMASEHILFGWEVPVPPRARASDSYRREQWLTLEQARTLRAHLARLAELCAGRCDDALARDDYAAAAHWFGQYRKCARSCRSLSELIHAGAVGDRAGLAERANTSGLRSVDPSSRPDSRSTRLDRRKDLAAPNPSPEPSNTPLRANRGLRSRAVPAPTGPACAAVLIGALLHGVTRRVDSR